MGQTLCKQNVQKDPPKQVTQSSNNQEQQAQLTFTKTNSRSSVQNITIYWNPMSQPSRAIIIFTKILKVKFASKIIQLEKNEQKGADFLKINPFGYVPALTDGDLKILESGAVFRYLARTTKCDDNWYPKALVEQYLDWHHNGFRGPVSAMVFSKILAPMKNLPPSIDDETGKKNIFEALNKIETIFLAKNKFLAGDQMSIADLQFSQEALSLRLFQWDFGPWPKINYVIQEVHKLKETQEVVAQYEDILKQRQATKQQQQQQQQAAQDKKIQDEVAATLKELASQPITLFWNPMSQPSRAVLILCKILKIKIEQKVVDLSKNEQKSTEYLKINPFGFVPVLSQAGLQIQESNAILRYLCRTNKHEDNWYPTDVKKQALVEMYLDFHHAGVRAPIMAMVFSKILAPMKNLPPSVDDVTGNKNIVDALDKVQNIFLKNNKFLAGDKMSIADLQFSQELISLKMLKIDLSPWPKIKFIYDQVLGLKEAQEVIQIYEKVVQERMAQAQQQKQQIQQQEQQIKQQLQEHEKHKELTIYWNFFSSPSRTAVSFCRINNLKCTYKHIDLGKAEHKTVEYLQINPFGQVPVIQHGDVNVNESQSIMRYLCRTQNVPDHWYPQDPKKQAKVEEYLSWHHLGLRANVFALMFSKVFAPMFNSQPVIDDIKGKKNVEEILNIVETIFLKNTKFIAADEMSIADISFAQEAMQLNMLQWDFSKWPKIQYVLQKINELPGTQESMVEINQFVKENSAKYILQVEEEQPISEQHIAEQPIEEQEIPKQLEVFWFPVSGPSRSVVQLCKILGVDCNYQYVNLLQGQHKQPEYLNINPFGVVPCISDGKQNIQEHQAIMRYICRKYNAPEHWYPKHDLKHQAKIEEYLNWHHLGFASVAGDVLFNLVFAPMLNAPCEQDQEKNILLVEESLNKIENIFLKNHKFLTGHQISIADLSFGQYALGLLLINWDFSRWPKIQHILETIKSFPESQDIMQQYFTFVEENKYVPVQKPIISDKVIIYWNMFSAPSRAVAILAKIGNINCEFQRLDLEKNEQKSESYLQIHPFGQVPAITDGNLNLYESQAIMRYLCKQYNLADHWYPQEDLQKQAKVEEYLNYHHLGLRQSITVLVFSLLFAPRLNIPPLFQDEDQARNDINAALDKVENIFLKDHEYIAGDQISIADITFASEAYNLELINWDFSSWPKISEVMNKFKDYPATQEILQAIKEVMIQSQEQQQQN